MNSSFDLKQLPNELSLLIDILGTTTEERIKLANNEFLKDINWDHFLRLTMYHRLYPSIYLKLKNIETKYIPQFVIQTLHQEYKNNTFRMLKLSGEMEIISELFMGNNIRHLFLKGPIIALDLYGDISLRTSKDLDILISINDLDKVDECLLKYGYERNDVLPPLWKLRNKDVTYYHPQKEIFLEIHWRLHSNFNNEPTFEELWKRKRVKHLASSPIYFPEKEDLFLYLVAHGARHGWFRLRWLLDIHQIMNNQMNEEECPITLKKYHYRHLVWGTDYLGQALILTSMLFRTPIDNSMQSIIERRKSRILAKKTLLHLTQQAEIKSTFTEDDMDKPNGRYIFSIKPNTQRVRHIVWILLPSVDDVEILRLPKSLRFLYIPLRPLLWLWRKTRNLSK